MTADTIYLEKDPTLATYAAQCWLKTGGFYTGKLDNWAGPKTDDALALLRADLFPAGTHAPGRQVSKDGIALIQHFESCLTLTKDGRFAAYPDAGYGWEVATVGWGTVRYPNGEKVRKGDIISQTRADEYLAWEVAEKSAAVTDLLKVEVSDDAFAALVCFTYNVGIDALKNSTLLALINRGRISEAADEFPKWNKSSGKVLAGLTRRRVSERNLFLGKRPFLVA